MPIEHYETKTLGWRARAVFYHDGRREPTKWVACDGPDHEPDALKRWLASKESMLLHGRLGQVDHEITVGSIIDAWEDADGYATVAVSDYKNRRSYLRWWREEFGYAKYHSLHRPLIQQRLRQRWSNPATRNRARAALGSIITWHMQQGTLTEHLLKGLSEPERPATDDAYSEEELGRLFDALRQEDDPRPLVAAAIALSTGARQAAIWSLQVQDVDLGNGYVRFQRNVKRGKHRAVPLQRWVERLILNKVWPEWDSVKPETPLFRGTPKAWPAKVWNRAVKRAKLERRKPFHTLRHTFVTRALAEGVPIQWVTRFSGHSDTTVMARYKHLTDQAMARAFSREQDSRSEAQRLEDATRLPRQTP